MAVDDEQQQTAFQDSVNNAAQADTAVDAQEQENNDREDALVRQWQQKVTHAEGRRSSQFKQMREDMAFARGIQWEGQTSLKDDRYTVNITQRHVSQRVSELYAKNPTFVARRRNTMDFEIWDEMPESLDQARKIAAEGEQNPQILETSEGQKAIELLQDVYQGSERRHQLDKMAQTMQTVFKHELHTQIPPFKQRMKALVRRAVTTGVGFVKLGYHRTFEARPEDANKVTDVTEQLTEIARLISETDDEDKIADYKAEQERLKYMMEAVASQGEDLTREGLDFDFPKSTSIIIDLNCTELKGFIGAQWVAQKFLLTPNRIQEIYGVDLGKQFTAYTPRKETSSGTSNGSDDTTEQAVRTTNREASEDDFAAVYEIYDKHSGLVSTICDGHPKFLVKPKAPDIKLSRFWPFFVLTFNDVEDESNIYPPSDVQLIKSPQVEMNLSRERLREHRDASRPDWVTGASGLDQEDKQILQSSGAFRLLSLKSLQPGQNVKDLIQPKPTAPIDPNLYQTAEFMHDVLLTTGTQQANFGGTNSHSATQSSIANASLTVTLESAADELDEMLADMARSSGELLLRKMSRDTVEKVAGAGAVWPELTAEQAARQLYLTIEAGSSGRPNRAQQIQNIERLAPYLLQVPGLSPHWLLKQLVSRMDENLDVSDAYIEGAPSITALNQAQRPSTGNPATDPGLQGPRGGEAGQPKGSGTNLGPNNATSGAPNTDHNGTPVTAPNSQH